MKETDLRKKIKDYLISEYGCSCHVIHGSVFMETGIPDLVGCLNGKMYWIEVKCKGSRHDKNHIDIQSRFLERERSHGALASFASCIEHVDKLFETGQPTSFDEAVKSK